MSTHGREDDRGRGPDRTAPAGGSPAGAAGAAAAATGTPEERAQEAVRALPAVEPRPAWRQELRRQFLEGRVPPTAGWERRERARGLAVWLVAAPAVAAVAAALVLALNRPPAWRVLEPSAGTALVVDGEPLDPGAPGARSGRLRAGARVAWSGAEPMALESPGNLLLQLLPGTEVTLPASPGRWFGRTVRASIAQGELRIVTGDRFRGGRLYVATPEAEVEVVGTTLAVIRPEFGTCICVFDGTVYVSPLVADAPAPAGAGGDAGARGESVPAGRRFTIVGEDGSIDRGEMLAEERRELGALRNRWASGTTESGGAGNAPGAAEPGAQPDRGPAGD